MERHEAVIGLTKYTGKSELYSPTVIHLNACLLVTQYIGCVVLSFYINGMIHGNH